MSLLAPSGLRDAEFHHSIAIDRASEVIYLSGTTASNARNFPLYLYPEESDLDQSIRVNMEPAFRRRIEAAAMGVEEDAISGDVPIELNAQGEPVIEPRFGNDGRPNEVAIFDYIYGVLHCPDYRETYKEFLKIDFPRIPWPPSPEVFRDVQEKGTQLRQLHLMEDAAIGETPYPFTGEGDSVVGKIAYENGAVFINDMQCFENVPR